MTRSTLSRLRVIGVSALLAVAVVGCKTAPGRPELPPSLRLLESAQLYVPDGCPVESSIQVDFVVLEDGRTGQVHLPEVAPCLQEALVAWVESFRYAPPGAPTGESVEWLLVTGRRGS